MEECTELFTLNWLTDLENGEQFSGGKLEINEEEIKIEDNETKLNPSS